MAQEESGKEFLRTDEYGNPVFGAPAGGYTTAPHEGTIGGAGHAQQHQMQPEKEHHGLSGMLHRSGSSSSSSSEDDGEGGRRKKGIKEKIKDKLPGGHHEQQGQPGEAGGEQHEKKGIMEKIKEKLPGGDN